MSNDYFRLEKENLDLRIRNAQLEKEKAVLINDIKMKWHSYEQRPEQSDDYVQTYINNLLKDCNIS